jgi:hypothetical protein
MLLDPAVDSCRIEEDPSPDFDDRDFSLGAIGPNRPMLEPIYFLELVDVQ